MKKKFLRLNLRLFDANVQTTTLNTSGNDLSPEMKTYYSAYLIDNATPNLIHDQFGQKHPIPKGGGKTIEFRKYDPLPKALTPITEGVTPSGNKLNTSTITATVAQYGDYITLSDMLLLTAIDNNLVEATELLGDQAGRTLDTVTREVLNGGTNVMYAPNGTTEVTSRSAITANCKVTLKLVMKVAAMLKTFLAKKIEGSYVGIVHPYVAYDLMSSEAWIDINKYAEPGKIFEGEIGKIGGVRFVETSEAKIWEGEGADGVSVYSTLVMGANAYGVTEVTGGGLQHIVKQLGSGGTTDPLNQRATAGWKATKVAERLVEAYMVRIESCSEFATAAAN
ncbi:MAG: N4-gp56 family major capsid protein [Lachnospiraceae bacterium]|nr:N4-gp56 family major capsid protein [Lachnospiraceae bacterium]